MVLLMRMRISGLVLRLPSGFEVIGEVDSEGSVLRSNHISNYVQLRGTMNRDKARMLADLDEALKSPELDNPYIEYLENL